MGNRWVLNVSRDIPFLNAVGFLRVGLSTAFDVDELLALHRPTWDVWRGNGCMGHLPNPDKGASLAPATLGCSCPTA